MTTFYLSAYYAAGQQFTNAGQPLNGGKLYTYIAGTSTPLTTYTDNTGMTANANPIILSAYGRITNEIWTNGATPIKYVLEDQYSNILDTKDNIPSLNLPIISSSTSAATLQSLGIVPNIGVVTLVQSSVGTWTLYNPYGVIVNISASTTDGLQEAINLACTPNGTQGYDLLVQGLDATPFGASVINCTTPINVPALQGKKITISSCTINFTSALGSSNGFSFDSLEMAHVYMPGSQIVYFGTGWAVAFIPTHGTPGDNIITSGDSYVHLNSIAIESGAFGGVLFDPTYGPMSGMTYVIDEIEGTGTNAYGLAIYTDTYSFNNNTITVGHIHGMTQTALLVGTNNTDTGTVANKFFINTISPGTTSSPAVIVWGQQNYFNIAINAGEGTPANGIALESTASKNIFDVLRNDATSICTDSSTSKDNVGMCGIGSKACSVNLNGTNQTGVLNNTATAVVFTNAVFNENSSYNFVQNWWIPGTLGFARISASVQLVTEVTATPFNVYVYKNGSPVAGNTIIANGTSSQTCSISFTVPVLALTDYFQIYVIQATGSTQSIYGASGSTFANFEMISGR